MPSVTQGGGYTLTFSKKNEDIKDLIIEKKKKKGFILTDYICDAIRFYEENKDNRKEITNINIEELVREEITKILGSMPIKIETKDNKEERSILELEKNLEDVDVEED